MLPFIITSVLLGLGLAMDAFSISLANGLHEPKMKIPRLCAIAGTFAIFQGVMPMLGWVGVHTVLSYFEALESFIPWVAFALLSYIGIKMIVEGLEERKTCELNVAPSTSRVSFKMLMLQGIATSIDALSVGLEIPDYSFVEALLCALIISVLTFIICSAGLKIGKIVGSCFSWKATIFGGVILSALGIKSLITAIIALI